MAAEESLQALEEYQAYYRESIEKGEGMTFITRAEMAQVLDDITTLFKGAGVGIRKNAVGQKLPERRAWERHG